MNQEKWKLYPETRNELPPLEVVCAGCGSLHRRAHPVPVVLTDEDHRQLPQSGHVVGFKDLTLEHTHTVDVTNEKTEELNRLATERKDLTKCLSFNKFNKNTKLVSLWKHQSCLK